MFAYEGGRKDFDRSREVEITKNITEVLLIINDPNSKENDSP